MIEILCLALLLTGIRLLAAPGDGSGTTAVEKLVSADKKLDPAWVQALTARGEPEVYRGPELKYIGMPVGGLFAGQLYLGGDGQLWHWDVFNQFIFSGYGGEHYVRPLIPENKLDQGFSLRIGDKTIPLNAGGFTNVSFRGEYPVGTVTYQDPGVPVRVTLEAFSPFIPLDTADSCYPATLFYFKIQNTSAQPVAATLGGRLENAVGAAERDLIVGQQINRVTVSDNHTFMECGVEAATIDDQKLAPDRMVEDWNKSDYAGWTVEGKAFGTAPLSKNSNPKSIGSPGGETEHWVDSMSSVPGADAKARDEAKGKLISQPILLDRKFLRVWLAGGDKAGKTCVNLRVDGKVVQSVTGKRDHTLRQEMFSLARFQGKSGVIEIVDQESGSWGNISVGRISLSDRPLSAEKFNCAEDNGSLCLALLDGPALEKNGDQTASLSEKRVGQLSCPLSLQPGEEKTVRYVLSWYFPNLRHLPGIAQQGRSYAARFSSARAVAAHLAANATQLTADTRLWKNTWYDSTMPYWFLDRTFLNASILATSTSYRFKDGRFWAWEGVGSCAGTCGHVWYYGQASGRLFPDIERDQREQVDFGLSEKPDGAIRFRGENNSIPAIDSQAGYILRALREHQMSADDAFLKRIWPKVKLAMDWMIAKDGTGNGMIKGNQHNTLDTDWFGDVAWLSGLYQSALLAAAEMADRMGDTDYAGRCREIAASGRDYMAKNLFNGEYYQNRVDAAHLDAINSGSGCEIDQLMGQSWAFQIGLPRVFPQAETLKSLESLWRYNFCPDVGPYRAVNKPGRWYAMAGEAGLLMCTFPRSDWQYDQAKGRGPDWAGGYFNECMNGFEHQVAGHMIWEGAPGSEMVMHGLAIERALHDRYGAAKRNPYDEIECGDHYGRSMASYGVFLAACGYEYDGPRGHLGFAPKIHPEQFKSAFTAAEGWGSFEQTIASGKLSATLDLKWGKLALQTFSLVPPFAPAHAVVRLHGQAAPATVLQNNGKAILTFSPGLQIAVGDQLSIELQP